MIDDKVREEFKAAVVEAFSGVTSTMLEEDEDGVIDAATGAFDAARAADLREAVALVRKLEWGGNDLDPNATDELVCACPACETRRPYKGVGDHASDCPIAAFLAKHKEVKP